MLELTAHAPPAPRKSGVSPTASLIVDASLERSSSPASPIGGARGFGGCQNGASGGGVHAFGGGDGGAATSQKAGEYEDEKVVALMVGEVVGGGREASLPDAAAAEARVGCSDDGIAEVRGVGEVSSRAGLAARELEVRGASEMSTCGRGHGSGGTTERQAGLLVGRL